MKLAEDEPALVTGSFAICCGLPANGRPECGDKPGIRAAAGLGYACWRHVDPDRCPKPETQALT